MNLESKLLELKSQSKSLNISKSELEKNTSNLSNEKG